MDTTTTTRQTVKCDKRGCSGDAAWTYKVNTLYGIEEWQSCQAHVREVRQMHGMNIISVRAR